MDKIFSEKDMMAGAMRIIKNSRYGTYIPESVQQSLTEENIPSVPFN